MADLSVEFCGLKFKNPMVVSSIEPTNSLDKLKACVDAGAGGAVVKTLTDTPQMSLLTDHSKYAILNDTGRPIQGKIPRFFVFYSRSGYSTTPYQQWKPYLLEAQQYAEERGAHIIGSIGAGSIEGWKDCARTIEDCGIKMTELNFGCPHPSQMEKTKAGMLIGQDPDMAAEITALVAGTVDIPVVVKLTPQTANLLEIAKRVKEAGAAAVTVINRYVGFAVDIETGEPFIGGAAGVGGPWAKYMVLRWVHEIHSNLGIPISGTNGIYDWRDAIEFFMSGATVMQVGSVLMLKGYRHLGKIIEGINDFLDEHGYPDIPSIVGMASRKALTYEQLFTAEPIHAVINYDTCTSCGNCVRSCFYNALAMDHDKKVITSPEKCIGCELCSSVCPVGAVSYEGNQAS